MPSPAVSGRLPRPDRSPHRESRRSTYFASTSASRLTAWPGSRSESVVAVSVCGTSATRECVSRELGDRQRHAVHGDRALLDAVAQDLVGRLDEDAEALALGFDRLDAPHRVDVSLDVVPPELLARSNRRLDVHARRRARGAERRARDRSRAPRGTRSLRSSIAVAVRQQPSIATESPTFVRAAVSGARTTSARPPPASSASTTTPSSRTIPVNTAEP